MAVLLVGFPHNNPTLASPATLLNLGSTTHHNLVRVVILLTQDFSKLQVTQHNQDTLLNNKLDIPLNNKQVIPHNKQATHRNNKVAIHHHNNQVATHHNNNLEVMATTLPLKERPTTHPRESTSPNNRPRTSPRGQPLEVMPLRCL